jgi:hypothetical protein
VARWARCGLLSNLSSYASRRVSPLHALSLANSLAIICLSGVQLTVLVPECIREWLRFHVLHPLLRALRCGTTPRRMAWSLALGMVVGINPTVGLATILVLFLAWALA